jgi:hypothetical protein
MQDGSKVRYVLLVPSLFHMMNLLSELTLEEEDVVSGTFNAISMLMESTKLNRKGALAFAGYQKGFRDSTQTPSDLMEALNSEFHFDFDPCPLNPTFDGLSVEWGNVNYVNPPYSNKEPWILKALKEFVYKKKTVVMLLPVDTSTDWYHEMIKPFATEIRFLRRRLKYPPNNTPAAFPSMIVVFKP